tara:strand:- start:469 stop:1410 length:942 start_codon:yes stop_codon:yes gene_type:complete
MNDQTAAVPAEEEIQIEITNDLPAPDQELDRHTKNVSKRVNKLNQRAREAEQRIEQYANALHQKEQELQQMKGLFVKQSQATLEAEEQKIKAQEASVDDIYKKAVESSDADLMSKATTLKNDIAIKKEKLNVAKAQYQTTQQPVEDQSQYQAYQQPAQQPAPQQIPPPEPTPEALAWWKKNPWYGDASSQDTIEATEYASKVNEYLIQEGFEPDSEEYYDELDKRISRRFADVVESRRAQTKVAEEDVQPTVQRVASATSSGRPQTRAEKNSVGFSESELARLKSLKPHNMELNDFLKLAAKEKLKIQSRGQR